MSNYSSINNNPNNNEQNNKAIFETNKNDINNNNNNINSQYNFNYNPPLTRAYSQGNITINKNNIIKNDLNNKYFNKKNNLLNKNKKILSKYFKLIMEGESQIELTKKNLISRKDFNCINAFKLFDGQNKGYITFDDLKNEFEFMGLTFNDTELQLLINRFNSNNEDKSNIMYENFCSEIFPYLSARGNSPKDNSNNNTNVFSPTTRLYFKALLKAMVDLENKLNGFKKENINIKDNDIIEILKEIDVKEEGYFNMNELIRFLKENNVYSSLNDASLLFYRYDKDKKGRVSYESIISDLNYL